MTWGTPGAALPDDIAALADPGMSPAAAVQGKGRPRIEILAANAKGDKSKVTNEAIPYRVITKDGGPEQKINGLKILNIKATELEAKLRADIASAKK